MITAIFFTLLGLVLILAGANMLTDGASAAASRLGVSDLMIGLTVVAFGTSAPELVISVIAAIQGNAPIAVGNVVGSNIFNILAIVGITALVRPIVIKPTVMTTEVPVVVLSSLVMLALGNTTLIDPDYPDDISRIEGLCMLVVFALFIRHTLLTARNITPGTVAPPGVSDNKHATQAMSPIKSAIWIVGGLAALIWGGEKFVDGASSIASRLGVSDAVIGLTIVAAGTSLPELATSIVAAMKGKPDIAVGNVIGSCVFNVFFVLATAAVISPLPFAGITNFDLLTLTLGSMLFLLFGWCYKERTITRPEGAVLAICYIAYITGLVINT